MKKLVYSFWYRPGPGWSESGNLDLKDKRCPGQPQKVKDKELEEVLQKNPCRTQSELAQALGVIRQVISKRQTQNFIKKAEN